MIPKELDNLFNEYTEDDYNIYVTKTDYSTDNFIIDFVVDVQDINDKGKIVQTWSVTTSEHRKNHISFDNAPLIDIKDEHPLLWEFTDIQCQLYFTGQCKDPTKLFYELYLTHKKLFGNHQCFNISFGEETTYFKPFQYSNGLLTEGPKKLMKEYGECLKQNGLDYTIIGEHPATYWNGEQFILENKDLKVLFIGNTYIIGESFVFALLDTI